MKAYHRLALIAGLALCLAWPASAQDDQRKIETAVAAILPDLNEALKDQGVTTDDGFITIGFGDGDGVQVDYRRNANGDLEVEPLAADANQTPQALLDLSTAAGGNLGITLLKSDYLPKGSRCPTSGTGAVCSTSASTRVCFCDKIGPGQRDYHYLSQYRYSTWYEGL